MRFFHKLEYKYGKYAIHNLMYYIVILYAIGLVMNLLNPMVYWQFFSLDIEKILHGQIWRLVTFLVYPPTLATWAFMDLFFGILVYQCVFWDHCSVYVPQPGADTGAGVGRVPV